LREKLICSDELEICGGFLTGDLDQDQSEAAGLVKTHPRLGDIFDQQYRNVMGFKNGNYFFEKKRGKFMFWQQCQARGAAFMAALILCLKTRNLWETLMGLLPLNGASQRLIHQGTTADPILKKIRPK
jgi:hypothetical protein